ncbi:MAG: two-component regulator propeller domain-containing protein, partial [Ignavibacteria bacterium]
MHFKFERISVEHGLSQSVVYQIFQDSRGFIWLCTQDGLNKYDGYKFKIYLNNPNNVHSLTDSQIQNIYEDGGHNLWIGSSEGTLSRYDWSTDKFINFNFVQPDKGTKITSPITAITEIDSNVLLLGTYGNGLIKFDKRSFKYEFMNIKNFQQAQERDFISCIARVKEKIIFGTWGCGLGIFDTARNKFSNFKFESRTSSSAGKNIIRTIYRNTNGNLFIGTNEGAFEIEINGGAVNETHNVLRNFDSHLSDKTVTSMCEDKNENIWVGTRYHGIYFIEKKSDTIQSVRNKEDDKLSLSCDAVICLFNDRSNVTWAGTIGEGICKHDGESKKFVHVPELRDSKKSIVSKNVVSFTEEDANRIWVGSYGKGLFSFDKSSGEMSNYNFERNNTGATNGVSVMSLVKDKMNLWVGLLRGAVNKFNLPDKSFEEYQHSDSTEDHIFVIADDKANPEKYLIVGTNNKGILKFDKSKKEFSAMDLPGGFHLNSEFVKCIFFDSHDDLWIGTNSGEGLFCVKSSDKKIINYKFSKDKKNGLSNNNILVINEDQYGDIWIGTYSKGLNKFDRRTESFKVYTTDDGLTNNSIRGILGDDAGNLWISTNKGINRFNIKAGTFNTYDLSDGLQSNEFNEGAYYKSGDGTMYFGGINGFNYFRPEEIKDNPYLPQIAFTDFRIFNQSVEDYDETLLKKNISVTKEINLSYHESVFSFEFVSLIFNNSSRNQYAYIMEGFDKEWIYSGSRRFVTYTNLEPGEYTFRVKGSNNDGIWNEAGASVKINITPPYWKTWWFKSLGVMSIIGATGMAYTQKLN